MHCRLERELEEERLTKQFQAAKDKLSSKQTKPSGITRRVETKNKSRAAHRVMLPSGSIDNHSLFFDNHSLFFDIFIIKYALTYMKNFIYC